MNNTSYIKEARKLKNISLENVAKKLNLNISVVRDIENGVELKGLYKSYESSYKNSIFQLLNIPIEHISIKKVILNNNSQILLTIYFVIFFSFSLMTVSHYLISRFSNNLKDFNYFNNYQDDDLMRKFKDNIKRSEIKYLEHKKFVNYLSLNETQINRNFLVIKSKSNKKSYYKLYFPNDNIEKFGSLGIGNEITINSKQEVFIDITNTSSIDYILFDNKKYQFLNDFRYYLKNFDIKELDTLK